MRREGAGGGATGYLRWWVAGRARAPPPSPAWPGTKKEPGTARAPGIGHTEGSWSWAHQRLQLQCLLCSCIGGCWGFSGQRGSIGVSHGVEWLPCTLWHQILLGSHCCQAAYGQGQGPGVYGHPSGPCLVWVAARWKLAHLGLESPLFPGSSYLSCCTCSGRLGASCCCQRLWLCHPKSCPHLHLPAPGATPVSRNMMFPGRAHSWGHSTPSFLPWNSTAGWGQQLGEEAMNICQGSPAPIQML